MKLIDLNRVGGIGANSLFVQFGDVRVLIDCGLNPKGVGRAAAPDLNTIRGETLDLIIITHCHLDHIGSLPVAMREHPNTPVIMTQGSRMLIERMLSGPLPEYVDCSSYLNRLATRRQVASRMIGTMMTSVQGVVLNAVRARAIAVAIAELFHFLDSGAFDAPVRVYLAVALDDDRLVVGIGAEGDVSLVVAREAHGALLRARSITTALGGDFQRGVDGARTVFGLTFPQSVVEYWS